MKKVLAAVLLFVFALAFVQAQSRTSEFYVRSVPILSIYPHEMGYRIVYMRGDMRLGTTYVPLEWMRDSGGKGEMVFGNDNSYPYFSVFYRNGEFDHVRVYAYKDFNHPSWGVLDDPDQYNDRFSVETLDIQY